MKSNCFKIRPWELKMIILDYYKIKYDENIIMWFGVDVGFWDESCHIDSVMLELGEDE